MRKFLLLAFLFLFSVSAFAQIRIEKRRYNKGWYVSLNHKKKSADEKQNVKSPENSFTSFQKQDSIQQKDEISSNQNPTNEPELIPVSQTSFSDSVLENESFVSVKPKQIKTENVLPAKLVNPVLLKRIDENIPVKSISFGHTHPTKKNVHQSKPFEDILEFLFELIIGAIFSIVLLIALVLIGLVALIAFYPAAALAVLAALGLISIILLC